LDAVREKEYASPIIDLVHKNELPNNPELPVFLDSGLPVANLAKQVLEVDNQVHLTGVNNSVADSTSDNMVNPASEIDTNVNRDTVITVEVVKKQHSRDTIIDVRTDDNNGVTVV
jgi:hypothetical protein